jgi:transposase-like protein
MVGIMKEQAIEFPTTLQEAMTYFADAERGLAFMVSLRWKDGKATCPHCQSDKVSFISTRSKWKCMACHKQFSAKVGTIFEDSALGYDKWFPAMWMIVNAKNGISSYEIHRALGVTQKTAWFMLQRIRLAMKSGSIDKLKGDVEIDETYIGGRGRFMHAKRKKEIGMGTGHTVKQTVLGMLERDGLVKVKHVRNPKRTTLLPIVKDSIEAGADVHTDALRSYARLGENYNHNVIDHAEAYVRGNVHTNGLENFWSLLKRALKGTYVSVDPVHLSRYLDEQVFRFNERKDCDAGRFLKAAHGVIGKGLTYLDLIAGKGGEDLLPA